MGKESAWMIMRDARNYYLLTRRSKSVSNPYYYNFAGGRIDNGEKPLDCAIREFYEECGYKILKPPVYKVAITGKSSIMHFFQVDIVHRPRISPNKEVDEVVWVPQNSLTNYPLHKPTFYYVRKYLMEKPQSC